MNKYLRMFGFCLALCSLCACGQKPAEMSYETKQPQPPTPYRDTIEYHKYDAETVLFENAQQYPTYSFDSEALAAGPVSFDLQLDAALYNRAELSVRIQTLRKNREIRFYVNDIQIAVCTRDSEPVNMDVSAALLPALLDGRNILRAEGTAGTEFSVELTLYSRSYLIQNTLQLGAATGYNVPEGLYGMNMEITRETFWSGLSAQMLNNRKFYTGDQNGPYGWVCTSSTYVTDHPERSLCSSSYVTLSNGGTMSYTDTSVYLAKGESYEIKVWTNADLKENVSLEVCINGRKITAFSLKAASGGYQELSYLYTASEDVREGQFSLKVSGGALDIYEVSMMNADHYYGMRKDVVTKLAALGPETLRYPGGCCADHWDFEEAVQSAEFRKPMDAAGMEPFLFTSTYDQDPFDLGLFEFMKLCEATGAVPELTVSLLKDSASAAALVAYCKNHAYSVIRYYIGNEIYFFGGALAGDAVLAAQKTDEYIRAMREIDPALSLIIGICVTGDYAQWSKTYLKHITESYQYISLHEYYGPAEAGEGYFEAQKTLQSLMDFHDERGKLMTAARNVIEEAKEGLWENVQIYVDEWNWGFGCSGSTLMFLGDAMYLHSLITNGQEYKIRCASFFHPLEGMISVRAAQSEMTAVGRCFQWFSLHKNQEVVAASTDHTNMSVLCTTSEASAVLSVVNGDIKASRLTVPSSIDGKNYAQAKVYTIETKDLGLSDEALASAGTIRIYQYDITSESDCFAVDIPGNSVVLVLFGNVQLQ